MLRERLEPRVAGSTYTLHVGDGEARADAARRQAEAWNAKPLSIRRHLNGVKLICLTAVAS